jgi:hypothetical protein
VWSFKVTSLSGSTWASKPHLGMRPKGIISPLSAQSLSFTNITYTFGVCSHFWKIKLNPVRGVEEPVRQAVLRVRDMDLVLSGAPREGRKKYWTLTNLDAAYSVMGTTESRQQRLRRKAAARHSLSLANTHGTTLSLSLSLSLSLFSLFLTLSLSLFSLSHSLSLSPAPLVHTHKQRSPQSKTRPHMGRESKGEGR